MKLRGIHLYVATTVIVALALFAGQDWAVLDYLDTREVVGLLALAVLGVASEAVAIKIRVAASQSSLTFIPVLATVLLFGPSLGVALAGVIIIVSEFILHEKPKIRAIFNVSQWIAVCALSGLVYNEVREALGIPREGYPEAMTDGWLLVPFAAFVLTLFTANYIAVAGAISLDSGKRFDQVLSQILGSAGANIVYGILISPIAFVVAVLYLQFDFRPLGLSIALLPLFFVRMSYLTNLKLQAANRDLLKALVKAIETRDPYTSGHSLRVSSLAGKIAKDLGLGQKLAEEIERAPHLHDIGKIEAAYTDILRKPDSLSSDERAVIESHVTTGAELLQSISSLTPKVVASVRHHHEREDGSGYPDGLKGNEIPLGAKIIQVCDAIDAMLSDRPYRDALDLATVREQLITCAGAQFDVQVVSVVVKNGLLKRHREEVLASKGQPPLSVLEYGLVASASERRDLSSSVKSVLNSIGSRAKAQSATTG
jgi:putative nucleotidyltransferase with HDIG domain